MFFYVAVSCCPAHESKEKGSWAKKMGCRHPSRMSLASRSEQKTLNSCQCLRVEKTEYSIKIYKLHFNLVNKELIINPDWDQDSDDSDRTPQTEKALSDSTIVPPISPTSNVDLPYTPRSPQDADASGDALGQRHRGSELEPLRRNIRQQVGASWSGWLGC